MKFIEKFKKLGQEGVLKIYMKKKLKNSKNMNIMNKNHNKKREVNLLNYKELEGRILRDKY